MPIAIPNTWKLCQDKKLNKIYDEVYEEANRLGFLKNLHHKRPLYIRKSIRSWGLCKSHRVINDIYDSVICLNEVVASQKEYETARKIIVHEIAHAATPKDHHGNNWHRIGDLIGAKWNIKVERTDNYEGMNLKSDDNIKYIVECPKCHVQWKYNRMCKTVEKFDKYRCGKCKETLIRIK